MIRILATDLLVVTGLGTVVYADHEDLPVAAAVYSAATSYCEAASAASRAWRARSTRCR